jgi:AraC-like DNA-binding protein
MRKNFNFGAINFSHFFDNNAEPSNFQSHCHEFFEIIYVVQGSGRYVVEGNECRLEKNTMMIFRPNEYHYVDLVSDRPYERYVLHFEKSFFAGVSEELVSVFEKAPGGIKSFRCAKDIPLSALSIFERIDSLSSLPEAQAQIMIKHLVCELLVLLSLADPHTVERENDPLGARVIKYLNDNISSPVSLDELAKNFYVSKYYLCRAFKAHNGISIVGYLNSKRAMLAKEMIENGETAASAAYRVGFGDYSSFYRAYKKALGQSPKQTVQD